MTHESSEQAARLWRSTGDRTWNCLGFWVQVIVDAEELSRRKSAELAHRPGDVVERVVIVFQGEVVQEHARHHQLTQSCYAKSSHNKLAPGILQQADATFHRKSQSRKRLVVRHDRIPLWHVF